MVFKIGDKVKIVKSDDFSDIIGRLCEVTAIMPKSSLFACRVTGGTPSSPIYPYEVLMFDWEIERVVTKGQQLLFSFMKP